MTVSLTLAGSALDRPFAPALGCRDCVSSESTPRVSWR